MEIARDRYINDKMAKTKWFACPICKIAREEFYSYEQHKRVSEYYPEIPTYGKEKQICSKCQD
tara:strand:+ start:3139 stop:3327 length:189 start_codon:yes stop_codon:yes gene_type:complete